MSAKGGITEGKSHKEGGIPMVVKSTGQHVELEGGEGVVNKRNMASTKTYEFEGKQMTTCEIASEINSADGNGVKIDCDNVTGKKYEYAKGGKILDEEQESSFKEWMDDGNVVEFEKGVYSTQDAQYSNRLKGMDELRRYFRKEFLSDSYAKGGGVEKIDKKQLLIDLQNKYLEDYYNATLETINQKPLPPKVIAKAKKFALQYANKKIKEQLPKRWYDVTYESTFGATYVEPNVLASDANEAWNWTKNYNDAKKKISVVLSKDQRMSDNDSYEGGGSVEDYKSLIGKYVNIYSMGVSLPTEHQIKDVMVSGENFRYRYITLKFDIGIAPIPLNEGTAFMNNEIIYVNDNKEEFGIQLIPNQYAKGGRMSNTLKIEDYETASMSAGGYEEQMIVPQSTTGIYKEGGDVPKASKMFHLPLELAVYVPSTQDVDKVISESELKSRVDEVSKYLATIFGGFTKSEKVGGFMTSQSELVTEDVVPVVSFATKSDYEANKNKLVSKLSEWARKWGQEAIGFEFEGDLYYVPQKFDKGGDVRDFDWYKGFKKDQLKKGTEHEMEHIDTIRGFKKKGVSDREVAEAIAKDHLEEDENYYIELDKMESSRKLSEAIKEFEKYKAYRKNSRKYKHGGYMGEDDSKEIVHITFNSDVDAVIRDKQGKYIGESKFPKETIHKFTFKHNDGRNSTLELLKGAFIVVPNEKINIVGFNEQKFGNGGSVKAYQSIPFSENDKKIAKMLTQFTNPASYNSRQRQKLSTFRGSNVVNELSSGLIQKIYGLLFEYHNIENPIKQLYLSNVGAGNIVSYAPKYVDKLMIDFDESNRFVEIEKEINAIINVDKKYTLSNPLDLRYMDAFIHVYSNTNPDKEELNYLFLQSEKSAVALGVCEFTSRERLDKFQRQIVENQGGFAQNQMIQYKNTNKYLIVNEGITDEGQYTLIYVMTKF
jgi:hypothetical protein